TPEVAGSSPVAPASRTARKRPWTSHLSGQSALLSERTGPDSQRLEQSERKGPLPGPISFTYRFAISGYARRLERRTDAGRGQRGLAHAHARCVEERIR